MSKSTKIKPDNMAIKGKMYKGKAPFKVDRGIYWILKMIFQVLILSLIYNSFIHMVRNQHGNNFYVEIIFVIFWIMISDLIAHVFSLGIEILFDKSQSYFRNKKKRKNISRKAWEQVIYTLIRAICYIFGITQALSSILYPNFTFLSTIISWVMISILSIALAKGLAIFMALT